VPGRFRSNAVFGIPRVPQSLSVVRRLDANLPIFEERNYVIAGVSRDSNNNPLANCTVYLFNWNVASNSFTWAQTTTSDGSGNYSFAVDKTQIWRVIMDNASGPVAGVSRNDLVAT
jgi:hypothetical protein